MQDIKNFQKVEATPARLNNLMAMPENEPLPEQPPLDVLFLVSEDGQDWYESQALFADDTIKIMYDENNVIRSVVAEPVPARGNTLAVSMFFPENMSVAEIDGELPEGFDLSSGLWKFDGETVYRDDVMAEEKTLARNKAQRQYLASVAGGNITALQSGTLPGDAALLVEWQNYLNDLRTMTEVELSQEVAPFPAMPEGIFS